MYNVYEYYSRAMFIYFNQTFLFFPSFPLLLLLLYVYFGNTVHIKIVQIMHRSCKYILSPSFHSSLPFPLTFLPSVPSCPLPFPIYCSTPTLPYPSIHSNLSISSYLLFPNSSPSFFSIPPFRPYCFPIPLLIQPLFFLPLHSFLLSIPSYPCFLSYPSIPSYPFFPFILFYPSIHTYSSFLSYPSFSFLSLILFIPFFSSYPSFPCSPSYPPLHHFFPPPSSPPLSHFFPHPSSVSFFPSPFISSFSSFQPLLPFLPLLSLLASFISSPSVICYLCSYSYPSFTSTSRFPSHIPFLPFLLFLPPFLVSSPHHCVVFYT